MSDLRSVSSLEKDFYVHTTGINVMNDSMGITKSDYLTMIERGTTVPSN
jgi:hypothetical protein